MIFLAGSTQPNSRSDNTKRSKKNTSRAQKPQFTRLSTHTRKQRKSTPKSKKVKRAHKTMSTKIGKPQTKHNVHQNLTTELLTFCHTLTSNFNSPPDMLPFLSKLFAKKAKGKNKIQITLIVYDLNMVCVYDLSMVCDPF